jgi:sporulation protein YlmC with PRC-barrel domain
MQANVIALAAAAVLLPLGAAAAQEAQARAGGLPAGADGMAGESAPAAARDGTGAREAAGARQAVGPAGDAAGSDGTAGDRRTDAAPVIALERADMAGRRRAGALIGAPVLGSRGDALGELEDVVLDPGGQVTHGVVGIGGVLGLDLGQRRALVAWDRLSIERGTGETLRVRLDMTAGAVREALGAAG